MWDIELTFVYYLWECDRSVEQLIPIQGQNLRGKSVWGTQKLSSWWWELAPVPVPQSWSHVPTQAAFPIHLIHLATFCFQRTGSVGACFVLLPLWFSLCQAAEPQEQPGSSTRAPSAAGVGSPGGASHSSRSLASPLLVEVSMLKLTLIPQGTNYQLNKTGAQG